MEATRVGMQASVAIDGAETVFPVHRITQGSRLQTDVALGKSDSTARPTGVVDGHPVDIPEPAKDPPMTNAGDAKTPLNWGSKNPFGPDNVD